MGVYEIDEPSFDQRGLELLLDLVLPPLPLSYLFLLLPDEE